MIPFENTLPYEKICEDLYLHECPFCGRGAVLLPWKVKDLRVVQSHTKKWLVLPCCHESFMVIDADEDYLLADVRLRPMSK